MKKRHLKRYASTLLLSVSIVFSSGILLAEEDIPPRQNIKPLDGELVLPDDYNKASEKKCMTVCEQWGEDCIINPRTGTRKCRRVCKSFGEECF